MRLDRNQTYAELIAVFALAAALWLLTATARAAGPAGSSPRQAQDEPVTVTYEVLAGDSLSGIAAAHGVELPALMEANEIANPDRIRAGMTLVVPVSTEHGIVTKKGVVLRVPKGVTLSRIAEVYGVPWKALARANGMKNPDQLRAGQRLLVPGATLPLEIVPPPPCFKEAVTLYRVRSDESRIVPLCFCDGRPNPAAVETLSTLSAPTGVDGAPLLDPRLAQLLQQVAERYPGKRIELISGYRPGKQASRESFHSKARAIDFRVEGVPHKALAFFARTFDDVGVGYYPHSVFIHMDVRERSAWWIDYSRPGEKAIYGRAGMTDEEVEAIRARRAAAVAEATPAAEPATEIPAGIDDENETAPVEPSPAA